MSNAKLAEELEALAGKATVGPWEALLVEDDRDDIVSDCKADPVAQFVEQFDGALIIALVSNLPAILKALRAEPDEAEVGDGWMPIETAPKDQEVLVWWPRYRLDEDDIPTDELVGGVCVVTSQRTGLWSEHAAWEEPDWLSGHGLHMDDDWCWASLPTHWRPLPAPPAAMKGGERA